MWLYEAKPIRRLPEAAEGQVLGAIDRAHAAFADLGLNFEMSELGANHGRWMVFPQPKRGLYRIRILYPSAEALEYLTRRPTRGTGTTPRQRPGEAAIAKRSWNWVY